MNDLYKETESLKEKTTKQDVINYLINLKTNVEEGNYDYIKSFLTIKEIEKAFKVAMEVIKDNALDVVSRDKVIIKDGYELKEKQGGAIWDFDNISTWAEHQKEMKKIEFEAKQNYNSLTKIKSFTDEEGNVVNEETGEELILPVVTYRKSSIQISKIKK